MDRAQKAAHAAYILYNTAPALFNKAPTCKEKEDTHDYKKEVDAITAFTYEDFNKYSWKPGVTDEQVLRMTDQLRGEKWFQIYKIFYTKTLSRETVLSIAKSMPVNKDDPALSFCLFKNSLFRTDREILWECARIEGKRALPNVLCYCDLDFIYEFIEKTHGVPGAAPYKAIDHNVIMNLYKHHPDNKELCDLVLSHYDICLHSLKNVIDIYTKKREVDAEHIADMFKRFRSPARKIYFVDERHMEFPGMVEQIIILENETGASFPELLDYFLPFDPKAYSAVIHYRPDRDDLVAKAPHAQSHRVFYKTKMTMSEETLALVTKHVDLMYPIPLPFNTIFREAKNVKVQTLINLNPMSFLERYISNIKEVVGNLVPEPQGKGCELCGEEFLDGEMPHHLWDRHIQCENILTEYGSRVGW